MNKIYLLISLVFFSLSANSQVTQINSNKSLIPTVPLPNGKMILVSETDNTIWASDGTLAGTIQISTTITYKDIGQLIDGKFLFAGATAATGTELFITDGSVAGTVLVKDINPGAANSDPDEDFVHLNGFVYFSAFTAAEGRELWRTNGTGQAPPWLKTLYQGQAAVTTRQNLICFRTEPLY